MIIPIGAESSTGKTLMAQRLLEIPMNLEAWAWEKFLALRRFVSETQHLRFRLLAGLGQCSKIFVSCVHPAFCPIHQALGRAKERCQP